MKKPAAPIDYSLYTGRWIALVLVNLISTAVKFTRLRQPAEIEIGCVPGEEAETVVFVRDNGVGFDMNYADKLFDVFQRLHRADEFEGTGASAWRMSAGSSVGMVAEPGLRVQWARARRFTFHYRRSFLEVNDEHTWGSYYGRESV